MKIYKIIKSITFLALATSIIFLKDFYVENLQNFIGVLITIYALDEGVEFFFIDQKENRPMIMCSAIVEFILGLCTLIWFKNYSTVCVIWAIWSIMRESSEFVECFELYKEKNYIPCAISFAESVVAIVFSILLVIEPGEHHAKTHMILLIIELVTTIAIPYIADGCEKLFKINQKAE